MHARYLNVPQKVELETIALKFHVEYKQDYSASAAFFRTDFQIWHTLVYAAGVIKMITR